MFKVKMYWIIGVLLGVSLCFSCVGSVLVQFEKYGTWYAQLESVAELVCVVKNFPQSLENSSVVIRRDSDRDVILTVGDKVAVTDPRYTVSVSRSFDLIVVKLVISSVQSVDEGSYKCYVRGRHDSSDEDINEIDMKVVNTSTALTCTKPLLDPPKIIQLGCRLSSFPKARVEVVNSMNAVATYAESNNFVPETSPSTYSTFVKIKIDYPSVQWGQSYKFQVRFFPLSSGLSYFNVSTPWITQAYMGNAQTGIYQFTANSKGRVVSVEYGSDVTFQCKTWLTEPTVPELYQGDDLLYTSTMYDSLKYDIYKVRCQHAGLYECRVKGGDVDRMVITLKVKSCHPGGTSPHSSNLAVSIVLPILGLALIILLIFFAICIVKRINRKRNEIQNTGNRGVVLSTLEVPNPTDPIYDTINLGFVGDGAVSKPPPPYTAGSYVVKDRLDAPPPYTEASGNVFTLASAPVYTGFDAVTQGQPHMEAPPPYPSK
ncbi:uncharacterized protein LOC131934792 [Physella acuta]|uniref:uncharacterized protein LOC131934792 n=1 Tax=Physella acuta TaxID=109671 RepID=UPI0027DD8910|nr:uncharacterized protein LOC131934792 [Physella acuta]XP_059146907.1 uncharacterized protein LOC131934792 [Physella acuta]